MSGNALERQRGMARALSDGSFIETYVTAALTIDGDATGASLSNTVIASGGDTDMLAYYGEMVGIYATILLVAAT